MSDKIIMHAGEADTAIPLDAQPDPGKPGYFLLESGDGRPLRGTLSLREHAYTIELPPGSFIIIEADEAELFKNSRSNDRVLFMLPSDHSSEFYVEHYITSAKGKQPYTALILRHEEKNAMISAALYPRDLESMPAPSFITPDGKAAAVVSRKIDEEGNASHQMIEHPQRHHDLDVILRAVFQPNDIKTIDPVDPTEPKKSWF